MNVSVCGEMFGKCPPFFVAIFYFLAAYYTEGDERDGIFGAGAAAELFEVRVFQGYVGPGVSSFVRDFWG